MCRYAMYGSYKKHYACFSCRKGFKRLAVSEWPKQLQPSDGIDPAPCPECGQRMADMGLDFKPPPRKDMEQWEVVEFLFRHGFGYHSCGCDAPDTVLRDGEKSSRFWTLICASREGSNYWRKARQRRIRGRLFHLKGEEWNR